MTNRYIFPDGVERVVHNVRARDILPGLVDRAGYKRALIICSKTINRKTGIVSEISAALGDRVVGVTDEVGEHAPVSNVLKAIALVRDTDAEVIISIGGGSVLDFCKFVQLGVSEDISTKQDLLRFQATMSADLTELIATSSATPKLRQFAVPTTLSTGEWTPGGTPVDDETRRKVRLFAARGAPQVIVYDPEVLYHTPISLLLSTGVRGLDHAINTLCAKSPHPFTSLLAEKAIGLFIENLPRVKRDSHDCNALASCQLAAWFTGMGQMTMAPMHGFSHFMVHIMAPFASVRHSDAACVLMLANARWIEGLGGAHHDGVKRLLDRQGEKFSTILEELLRELELPTKLGDLGITNEQVEAMIPLALAHPSLTRFNIRPIKTTDDLRAILALAR